MKEIAKILTILTVCVGFVFMVCYGIWTVCIKPDLRPAKSMKTMNVTILHNQTVKVYPHGVVTIEGGNK